MSQEIFSQNKPNTETNSEKIKENPEVLETVREFALFKDEAGEDKPLVVKEIGDFKEIIANRSEFPHASEIVEIFKKARIETTLPDGRKISKGPHLLVAGGFVRDLLLGKEPDDIDFATNATTDDVERIIKEHFKQELEAGELSIKATSTTDKNLPVLRVRFKDQNEEYEFATFRQEKDYKDGRRPESVETIRYPGIDADRRDLTINALFLNTYTGKVIDYVGGLQDISRQELRFVGDPDKRVAEDKIRMLRYVRFLLKTGFKEDKASWQVIQKRAGEIKQLSAEPIRDELVKIIRSGNYSLGLEKLKESGLLEEILPEVSALAGCEQGPPYHLEGDVFTHTKMVCDNLLDGSAPELVLAAYLHDIGKPATRQEKKMDENETKVSFWNHDKVSAKLAQTRLKELRFTNQQIKAITWLIEQHMSAYKLTEMREKKARELVENNFFDNLLILVEADMAGSVSSPDIEKKNKELLAGIKARVEKIREFINDNQEEIKEIQKVINGHEIIALIKEFLGEYEPRKHGRLVGIIKNKTTEEIVQNLVTDTKEAKRILTEIAQAETENYKD